MPIYEYRCESCGHEFEYLVFGSDQPECSACSSKQVNRMMSACGFISKGSGGETTRSSASVGSSCGSCSASSCSGCSH